jgi:hypothetical protein
MRRRRSRIATALGFEGGISFGTTFKARRELGGEDLIDP